MKTETKARLTTESIVSWNEYKKMTQRQVELCWLACLYYDPDWCRGPRGGLLGLDQSMFQDEEIFDLGLKILRRMDYHGDLKSCPDMYDWFANNPIVTEMHMLRENPHVNIGSFRYYAIEIERRNRFKWL